MKAIEGGKERDETESEGEGGRGRGSVREVGTEGAREQGMEGEGDLVLTRRGGGRGATVANMVWGRLRRSLSGLFCASSRSATLPRRKPS